jgi:hypothetical protein
LEKRKKISRISWVPFCVTLRLPHSGQTPPPFSLHSPKTSRTSPLSASPIAPDLPQSPSKPSIAMGLRPLPSSIPNYLLFSNHRSPSLRGARRENPRDRLLPHHILSLLLDFPFSQPPPGSIHSTKHRSIDPITEFLLIDHNPRTSSFLLKDTSSFLLPLVSLCRLIFRALPYLQGIGDASPSLIKTRQSGKKLRPSSLVFSSTP